MVRPSPKWRNTSADRSDFTVSSPIPSTQLGIWACGSTWRRHTGKHGSSAPHQRITQPTSWPHVASPTCSSTEQVARPATKRFHPSNWRPLETCRRPWYNDVTALAGYANLMMMMMMMMMEISAKTRTDRRVNGVAEDEVSVVDLPQHLLYLGFGATRSAAAALASPWHGHHRPQQQHNRPSRPDSNIITSKKINTAFYPQC